MSLIKGFHHVALKCCTKEEYEKTISFYKDVLELETVREWQEGIVFNAGSGQIEIFNNAETQLEQGAIRHFALATDNVDKCASAIKKAGYKVTIEPKDISIASKPIFEARIAFCIGPVGEEIEFIQIK